MMYMILFLWVILVMTVLLTYRRQEGWENPDPNAVYRPESLIGLATQTADVLNPNRATVGLTPLTTQFTSQGVEAIRSIPTDSKDLVVLPSALEQAKQCEKSGASCSAFDDPTFAERCGISFDSLGTGSDGSVHTGGLYISPMDRREQTRRMAETKDTDPFLIPRPTIGTAKAGSFALTKDNCVIVKERIECETKQSFSSPNCTQCYSSGSFSRVGPEAEKVGSTLYLAGNGMIQIQGGGITLARTSLSSSPLSVSIPANAEGAVFDITVTAGEKAPTFVAGYLEGPTGRGKFTLDLTRLIQSDKVTQSKPRLSSSTKVNTQRCSSIVPGKGQTKMVLSCIIPFSFIDPYTINALTCDNGPVITKESSATFLESDPCFSRKNRPGQYTMECLQSRWISLGGTQEGTGYPSTQEKADALQTGGKTIDTIMEELATRIRRGISGKTESGANLTIAEWNEDSMWARGIPINTPCDAPESQEGPLTRECLQYLYENRGITSHIGPTYTLVTGQQSSQIDQPFQNTYCQPGGSMSPSTDQGLAYGQRLGGVQAVKAHYDEIHRLANDNSKSNAERKPAVELCYGVDVKPTSATNKTTGPTQVFAIKGDYTRDQADGVCSSVGARLASSQELAEAQQQGADWCLSGWVSDSEQGKGKWPITTSVGCSNLPGTGVKTDPTPRSTLAVNCYGPKPRIGEYPDIPIQPFHPQLWDQPAEPTYVTVEGGFLETTQDSTPCFTGLRPDQAQAQCDQMGAACVGFNYLRNGSSGSGCFKGNHNKGKISNPDYMGYVKVPVPKKHRVTGGFDELVGPNQPTKTYQELRDVCTSKGMKLCDSDQLCPDGNPVPSLNTFGATDNWIAVGDKENEWITYATYDNRSCKTHTQVTGSTPPWTADKTPRSWARGAKCCPLS